MNSRNEDQFQSRSTRDGLAFRRECQQLLENLGFSCNKICETIPDYGVQIELIYNNNEDIALFFEATGTIEDEPVSTRPGLERTDTVKKIIATAFLTLKATGNPIIVLTSHSPDPELSSGKMLNMAGRDVILDVINVNIENDINRLKGYLNFNCNNLDSIVRQNKSLFE